MEIARGEVDVDWLSERIGSWASVGGVSAKGFEAYARLFHPVPVRDAAGMGATPKHLDWWPGNTQFRDWRWVAEQTGHFAHALMQWERIAPLGREGSASLGIEAPKRASLYPSALARVLSAAVGFEGADADVEVTAAIWDGWGVSRSSDLHWAYTRALRDGATLKLPGREYVLFTTSIAELLDPRWPFDAGLGWSVGHAGLMPQLLWPATHTWIVASEVDLDSTVIGGSKALIEMLCADPNLDAWKVDEGDSLALSADTLNL